ncbi:TPA: hypothetical protein ACGW3F_003134 [Bacillus paranthracis]
MDRSVEKDNGKRNPHMKSDALYTDLGHSKKGFGACGHWKTCSLGKGNCYLEQADPEVPLYCACYQRNHSDCNTQNVLSKSCTEEPSVQEEKNNREMNLHNDES